MTNDATRIRDTFRDNLVIKSLDTVLLRDGDDCLFTYTTVNPGTELNDKTVSTVPMLAQHALEEKTDIRVTIIGEKLFAVRVLSKGSGIAGDWRVVPKSELEFQDIKLTDDMATRCQLLTYRLRLTFARLI